MSVIAAAQEDGLAALVTWAAVATFDRWTDEHTRAWESEGVVYVPNARTGQQMPLGRELWDDLRANKARLDISSAAARLEAPWLIVHGQEDESVPVREAHQLHEAGSGALSVLPETGHTFGARHPMGAPPPALDQAIEATLGHFGHHLG